MKTDAYHKDTKKKFKDYDSFEGNESPEFPTPRRLKKLMKMDSFSIIEMMMNKKSLLMLIEEWGYKMLMGLKI